MSEEVSWEAAYQEFLPRVYNFFVYRVSRGPLAEDLTASTFEKAWRGRTRYRRDVGAFSTWLFSIARNVATDHFRRAERRISLDELRDQADPALVEKSVEQADDYHKLRALISKLPGRERELIALKYGAELTNREIGRLIDLSETNVGTILHRVVTRLRAEMDQQT